MILKGIITLTVAMGMVITPVLAGPPKELSGGAKRELKTLEGKWRVVRVLHSDRETTPGTDDDPVIIEFKADTIDIARSATGAVVELDPATVLKCLDFKIREGSGLFKKGSTYESVYKRDGDRLVWAVYTGLGKNRPTAFDKPTDAGGKVIVLKRVKE